MTAIDILRELRTLPLSEQYQVFVELNRQFSDDISPERQRDLEFIQALIDDGLITDLPTGLNQESTYQPIQRIHIEGEPLSEMIIRERR
ncbi:MAG: hypothetical protein KAX40_07630 [Herpetosiphon sp.]|nr:hypothetical protein [Herpetosiphon sp.]